jgi:hypothetical protein
VIPNFSIPQKHPVQTTRQTHRDNVPVQYYDFAMDLEGKAKFGSSFVTYLLSETFSLEANHLPK